MRHVVMFSGGIVSWAAAKRVVERHGTDDVTLLFADTRVEDEDTYRFLADAAANVGVPLTRIADGRTIWDVFRERRFLGNSRAALCSMTLKAKQIDGWLDTNCAPESTTCYVGLDWTEAHRYTRLAARRKPWNYVAPMMDAPYLTKSEIHAWATREGLRQQRLYRLGMAHANCGGGCVRAGAGHFARLYRAMPERFSEWERHEQELRTMLGDVSIVRREVDGGYVPYPLAQIRADVDAQSAQLDLFEIGGCGCFVEDAVAEDPPAE